MVIQIELRLFGAFRNYVPGGKFSFSLETPCAVKILKEKIHTELCEKFASYNDPHLVFESALATEEEILSEETWIDSSQTLALLPPVCGG